MTIAHRASHSRQRSSLASPTTKQRPFDLFYPFFFYLNGKNKDTLSQDTYTHRILKTSRHGDCRAVQGKMTQREGVFQWKVFADAVVPGPQGVFHPNQGQELRNILGGRGRGLTNQPMPLFLSSPNVSGNLEQIFFPEAASSTPGRNPCVLQHRATSRLNGLEF